MTISFVLERILTANLIFTTLIFYGVTHYFVRHGRRDHECVPGIFSSFSNFVMVQ
ncbi:hypothetical protein GEOBC_01170 [Geobacteraceae bacterium]|nr:hypothetical protein GEOBC_01170 [Geobacteraceae bacterium]